MAEDRERSASRRNPEISQHLGRLTAFSPFRSSQSLFLLIAEAGRNPRQREDGNQGDKGPWSGAQVKHQATDPSHKRARVRDSAHRASEQGESEREQNRKGPLSGEGSHFGKSGEAVQIGLS